MSASQPETPSNPNDANDIKGAAAQFPMVRRGYDRRVVDVRVAELVEELDKQRRRADEAEQEMQQLQLDIKEGRQLPAWFASLGAQVRQVGEHAAIAAEQLLTEAGTRAQAVIDGAEAEVADRRRAAEEQASNLEQTAQETLAQAEVERERTQAEATAAAQRLIAEAEARAQEAMDNAATQAAARLKAAEEEASNLEQTAQETLAQAKAEQARIHAEATAAAEELRARADRDAAALLDKAQEEATLAWQKAARERVLVEAETERLTTLRQRMVEQLGQVYAPLGLTLVDARQELPPSDEDAYQVPSGDLDAPTTATEQAQPEEAHPDQQGTGGSERNRPDRLT
jgi:hypothetical protein